MSAHIHGTKVHGVKPDDSSRCAHYHQSNDIIAIQFYCCRQFYCCYKCHEELCSHPPSRWPEEQFHEKAILCGNCGTFLSIREYLQSGYICPCCQALFNPACKYHYSLYFQDPSR
ncbi:CHY zinc finger protein [Salibacterium aidingense]|uniref:CHY zinc finger protein n=1 Tax=Salibacterium aidingense TaxID=384933 RepID=UPI003BD3E438